MEKQADSTPLLLTPREAAKLLNLPTRTIRRMIHSKELPALKVGSRWRIPRLHVTAAGVRSSRLG
jgi:excisionase family DNA binding protein